MAGHVRGQDTRDLLLSSLLGPFDVGPSPPAARPGLRDHPATAIVSLRVRDDACVTAFTQPTNYLVKVNGRFLESGCVEPRGGH
ncbi:hypothetical protein [Streptomyces sp. NPDC097981]|uniref:hypothetical protein n=1 Tax=Streptomyces sp. NPDC097981 TaxID=3155428 RepID=UPI003320FDAA